MSNHRWTAWMLPAACVAVPLLGGACASSPHAPSSVRPEVTLPEPASPWRQRMLERAFRTASMMPEKPHARPRARVQEEIATAALELGMLDVALGLGDRIGDWRRGEVLARAAQQLARDGDAARARSCMAAALDVAATSTGWMRDRVVTEVATAHVLLGEADAARRLAAQVPPEDTGKVEAALSASIAVEELDRQADAFDQAIATRNFDLVRSGIDGYLAWHGRVAGDSGRADRAARAIRDAAPGLPRDLQVTYAIRLADALAAHGDRDGCAAELAAAGRILGETAFLPEDIGPLSATVARARARHGDPDGAKALLQAALATFAARQGEITDIYRAGYLRPIAEALAAIGDRQGALECWMVALDAGALNPNAKPRAEDLCRTMVSMARAGVEPTEPAARRMSEIELGLKDPW